ncbi:amidoligase family protein [Allohahella sp. A8]|uniref:amidoligase family protein n=1 Tax=Allohahella sp. A8 TaxID=3141461 RepID=UPI000C08E518|nr:alpha-L-fucosidase [Hahellaceae bacterium]|tara:strand:- start:74669 stop:75700 length:1032 start_codon:yes stop_codon:yes gene_type:complete
MNKNELKDPSERERKLRTVGEYLMPPHLDNAKGERRKVGIEVELSGPEVKDLVELVAQVFNGDMERLSDREWLLHSEDYGTFTVEVDSQLLKRIAREYEDSGNMIDELTSNTLGSITKGWVPCEIVTPPLPIDEIDRMDQLIDLVRERGGKGTKDSIWNAFGLHFNPEIAALDADTILRHLQAYVCVHDWLVEHGDVDFSRRVTPYINPFESDYVEFILREDYKPDMDALIDDYIRFNPTRNRALDMLPMFMHIDEERVKHSIADPLVKPRPTFHYRLPNCDIDNPQWGLWEPWNDWVMVESLAADPARLREACDAYLKHLDSFTPDFIKPWKEQVVKWLDAQ